MHLRKLLLGCVLGTAAITANAASPYNPWLADSAWPQVHQGPWQQASVAVSAPASSANLGDSQYVYTGLVNVALVQSPAYANGKRVFWGGTIDTVYKVAVVDRQLKLLSSVNRAETSAEHVMTPFAGAYTAVRYDNTYLTGSRRTILAYRDAVPGDMNSSIALYKSYKIPESVVPDPGLITPDHITGMNVMFDGKIAVVTRFGYVGIVDIETGRGHFKKVGIDTRTGESQKISNNIAVSSDGGIYVVSNQELYRFQWTAGSTWETSALKSPLDAAGSCANCWREKYTVEEQAAGTLGEGSGSTPTLMGNAPGDYVVITDGAKVAKLSVYKTGQLAAGEPRLAAAMPVDFGDPDRARTASEQSVLVSGYGMVVVSNDYRDVENIGAMPWWLKPLVKPVVDELLSFPAIQNITAARVTLLGYLPGHNPLGVEKFSFDPVTKTLRSDWTRPGLSCPNSIPAMSETTSRFYCVGTKDYYWTIESLDWASGENHFRKNVGLLPRFNSFYAATQFSGDGGMIYGSVNGVVYLPPK